MNENSTELPRGVRTTRRKLLQTTGAAALAALIAPGFVQHPVQALSAVKTARRPRAGGPPPDPTGILRWGNMRGESYDPIRPVAVEHPQLNALFDTLLTIDAATGEIGPRLATEWEVLDDRLRLSLREGVVFQDGTAFDAEAVVFSLTRVIDDEESIITAFLPQVTGFEVVDALTADILLDPMLVLPLLIRLCDRPGMIVSPTAVEAAGGSDAFSRAPVGAGMYAIEGEWFPRESMSVRRWDGYWDPDAQLLGGIDFIELSLAAKVNALLSGAVDVASVVASDLPAVEGDGRLKVGINAAAGSGRGLVMNTSIAPLDILEVRQAIACAIDRDAAVQVMSNGIGSPAFQIFAPGGPGYLPELDEMYTFDLDRARQLLADAGFPDGVTFQSVIGASTGAYVTYGEFLQTQLTQAGITMDLQLVDQPQTIPMLYRERVAASAPLGGAGVQPAQTDNYIRDSFLADGRTNAAGTDVAGVPELLEQAGLQPDFESAAPYYQDISRIVSENALTISVMIEPAIMVYQPYVGGIGRFHEDGDVNPNNLRGLYVTEGQEDVE